MGNLRPARRIRSTKFHPARDLIDPSAVFIFDETSYVTVGLASKPGSEATLKFGEDLFCFGLHQ